MITAVGVNTNDFRTLKFKGLILLLQIQDAIIAKPLGTAILRLDYLA